MSSKPPSSVPCATDPPLALVLGGSRGLGLLIARQLLQRGHRVVIAARDAAELERAEAQLDRCGPVIVRPCDVRDRHAVHALVDELEEQVGAIEVLVTVAGVISVAPLESLTVDDFDEAVETMLWGPVQAAMAVLPAMRRRGRGRIATIASIGGMVSPPHLLPYATAKFGAVGFSDGLAAALMGTGVTGHDGRARTHAHRIAGTGAVRRRRTARVRVVRPCGVAAVGVGRRRSRRTAHRGCRAAGSAHGGADPAGLGRHPLSRSRPCHHDPSHGTGQRPAARRRRSRRDEAPSTAARPGNASRHARSTG